jgi:hypothetical protein
MTSNLPATVTYYNTSTGDLIAHGREMETHIKDCKNILSEIEEVLRSRALAMPHEPLENGSREGRRATLRDGEESLTVRFESDLLKASFDTDSVTGIAIEKLLPEHLLGKLFRTKKTYARTWPDGHQFRLNAASLLGPETATELCEILKDKDKNGIVKSKSVIEWNR